MSALESSGILRPDLRQRHIQFTRDYAVTRDPEGRIICDLPDPNQLMLSPREPRYAAHSNPKSEIGKSVRRFYLES